MTEKRAGNGSWQGLLMGLAALGMVMLSGCARRSVYIPPEWSAPPSPSPKTAAAPAPSSVKPSPLKPGPSEGAAPILKPPPSIKERDLSPGSDKAPPASDAGKRPETAPPPQHLASMHLVDQARAALAQGKPDDAIPLLEQAIQVDVYNGAAFLDLARAWRMKGNNEKALGFARKAEILFQDNPRRLKEVYLFEAEVFKDMGDRTSQEQVRSKASKL